LNFQKLPITNGTAFPGIFGKWKTSRRLIKFKGFFELEIYVPFDFPLEISGFFG